MKRFFPAIFALICVFSFSGVSIAENPSIEDTSKFSLEQSEFEEDEDESILKVEILKEEDEIAKGKPFSVILKFTLEDNWHLYWKNPGDSGAPPLIEWALPSGFKIVSTHWQTPNRFHQDSLIGFGYEKELLLLVDLEAPKVFESNEALIKASINWLACSNSSCLPGNSNLFIKLKMGEQQKSGKGSPYFEKVRADLPKKHFEVEACEKSDGLINLSLKFPENQKVHYRGGYFCSEEKDFIDHKNLLEVGHSDEGFHVNLTRLKGDKSQNKTLTGVLVLFHDKGNHSIAINTPLKKENSALNEDAVIAALGPSDISLDESQLQEKNRPNEFFPEEKSEYEGRFLVALFFAFIGGMLLNLMPCVLPVLSLKVLSFVKMSGEKKSLNIKHGLAFSAGVLLSFWILAAFLLTLQAYGKSAGWGFQLQEPIFVAFLASIIFILGLNLFGLMELGTSVTSLAGNLKVKKEGLTSSFFSGVLATAIATPCTGPFLGSAVGYAVTLSPIMALLIFTFLGAGMAFPYLLLAACPKLLAFVPKPGNWMVTFKELMGFMMMATTIWLLWVFSAETSLLSLLFLNVALLSFAVGCWIYGKWSSPLEKKLKRRISQGGAFLFMLVGVLIILEATKSHLIEDVKSENQQIASNWERFSPERIKELQAKGIPVFVDFTAKWCLICQTNHMSLTTNHAEEQFQAAGVVRMKADWTKNDPIITQELKKFGRNSVPLYVLYGTNPKEKPKILPQVLTTDIVVNHLQALTEN